MAIKRSKTAETAAQWVDITDLVPWENNPRKNEHAIGPVMDSIKRFGFSSPIIARTQDNTVIAGHTRLAAALRLGLSKVPVRYMDLDPSDARLLSLADNKVAEIAEWDEDLLSQVITELEEQGALDDIGALVGFDDDELAFLLDRGEGDHVGLGEDDQITEKLADKFGVVPFSILDSRRGWWRQRKRAWIASGIRSEEGRSDNLLGFSKVITSASGKVPNYYYQKEAVERELGHKISNVEFEDKYLKLPATEGVSSSGTSIFDPVVCELAYRWFCPPGGTVLDPFAGGSVRGIVSAKLGRPYIGVDLRQEQVDANRVQAHQILGSAGIAEDHVSRLIEDPDEITPIDVVDIGSGGTIHVKRDDLFSFGLVRGSKARAGRQIAMESKGLCAAGSRHSTMLGRVARLAKATGIPARIHVAPANSRTRQELDAIEHGAELVFGKAGYLQTLVAFSRRDAESRDGWTHIQLGLESDTYTEVNRKQAQNIPPESKRLVVCVGSGNGLSTILHGMDDAGLSHIPVLGVRVGIDPTKLLDRRGPADWRDRVELVESATDFNTRAPVTQLGGIELDPYYEAKCLPFLREGDTFYVLAIRTVDIDQGAQADQDDQEQTKPWQKGIPLDRLKEIREVFKEFDDGMVLGAFGAFKERDIASAWTDGSLYAIRKDGVLVGVVIARTLQSATSVGDFTGTVRAKSKKGDIVISRFACTVGNEGLVAGALRSILGDRCGRIETWNEHERALGIVESAFGSDASVAAIKVRASSEQVRSYVVGRRVITEISDADRHTITPLTTGKLDVISVLDQLEFADLSWNEHYSSYNKRKSWWAVALRGYGGLVDFIEKPDEMSKKWKKDNPEKLEWELEDTDLRSKLPAIESILESIPGVKHRVRLMRLDGRSGELSRHADITDKLAGTKPGCVMRIHVPLVTSEGVVFRVWNADGSVIDRHFGVGEAFYLDTRKPHSAVNKGDSDRIHLVVDVESNDELLNLLGTDPEPHTLVIGTPVELVEVGDLVPSPVPGVAITPTPKAEPRKPVLCIASMRDALHWTPTKGCIQDAAFSALKKMVEDNDIDTTFYNVSWTKKRPARDVEAIDNADTVIIFSSKEFLYRGLVDEPPSPVVNPMHAYQQNERIREALPHLNGKHIVIFSMDAYDTSDVLRNMLKGVEDRSWTFVSEQDFPTTLQSLRYNQQKVDRSFLGEPTIDLAYWGTTKRHLPDGKKSGDARYGVLKDLFTDKNFDIWLSGNSFGQRKADSKWNPDLRSLIPSLCRARATACFQWPDHGDKLTARYHEAMAFGLIPFVHVGYDTNNQFGVEDWQRFETATELKEKLVSLRDKETCEMRWAQVQKSYNAVRPDDNEQFSRFADIVLPAVQKLDDEVIATPTNSVKDYPIPVWHCGDSSNITELASGVQADFVFSCPPYADLEVYSDDPRDLSTMEYQDFRSSYFDIINRTCAKLKMNRFACFVVGEARGKHGNYYNFVGDTIEGFRQAGLSYYNEGILVTSAGSWPLRLPRVFGAGRKFGKIHQNVLVFVKGDWRKAVAALGEVEQWTEAEIEESGNPYMVDVDG